MDKRDGLRNFPFSNTASRQDEALVAVELPRELSDVWVKHIIGYTPIGWLAQMDSGCISYSTKYFEVVGSRKLTKKLCKDLALYPAFWLSKHSSSVIRKDWRRCTIVVANKGFQFQQSN